MILEPKKRKPITTSTFSAYICHAAMGPDAMILVFLIFSLKLALSLSSFTLINRLFSPSLLSTTIVVSSAYLRLLMFLPPILILACNLSAWDFSWYAQHIGWQQTALLYSFLSLEPINCLVQCCQWNFLHFYICIVQVLSTWMWLIWLRNWIQSSNYD